MTEATVSAESGYQEIFTAFFVGASEADAHYYLVKALNDDIPSLARLLGMSQDNTNKLLLASGFGSLRNSGQFIFAKNKFESFLVKHELDGICELVQRKPKGFGNQHYLLKLVLSYGMMLPSLEPRE